MKAFLMSEMKADRVGALRRFATTNTLLTVIGHLYLGFEMAYIVPIVAVLVAYATKILLEYVRASAAGQPPLFSGGGIGKLIDFLLPAHIIGLTCAAFIYPGHRIEPIIFATVVAIASMTLFRVRQGQGSRHFFNASNVGILLTLVCFKDASIFLPYQFSSLVDDTGRVALPLIILLLGTLINLKFAKRVPLVAAWLVAFIGQGLVRAAFFDAPLIAVIGPASGAGALIFTFFMITDPGTTPERPLSQMIFGASVGILYGILVVNHVVYGVFWALAITCAVRGALLAFAKNRGANTGHNQTPHSRESHPETTQSWTPAA